MKIKIKFRQDDYKASYKVKLSETEKEKYKKNPISYCFNKMITIKISKKVENFVKLFGRSCL